MVPPERTPLGLPPEAVAEALNGLPGWRVEQQRLQRTVTFGTFMDAIAFVGDLAHVAEELNHHPDIDVRWRTVHLGRVSVVIGARAGSRRGRGRLGRPARACRSGWPGLASS